VQYRLLDGKTAPDKLPRRRKLLPLMVSAVCVLAALVAVLASMWYDQKSRRPAAVSPDHAPAFVVAELPENLDDGLSAAEIMQKVGPSVVCIDVYLPGSLAVAGSASGIVMNEQGYIVTNAHVVEDVSGLRVTLSDGRAFDGVFVGSDKATDLAVIQIKAEQLTPAQFGDSTQLQVGERVLAIGNAAGLLSSSATQGIVSGLGRQIGPFDDFGGDVELIQTDAALNPGNSGGALVNRFGQVIGISSAKLLSVEFEGIGFAIPIHILRPVAQALIASGHVERAALGISVEALNAVTGSLNDLPSQGLYIQSVEKASNLNSFDIVAGDIIIKADGAPMHTAADLSRVLAKYKPGDTLPLEIQK
ncbi:MAG: trypsin-like peptidase domain-containing protein, partial [Ruthenibacterium sp.]